MCGKSESEVRKIKTSEIIMTVIVCVFAIAGIAITQKLEPHNKIYTVWDGKLYESDIVRACIRPKVKAIGKLVGKHIRDDPKGGIKVNTEANIRFLLSEPNPYMTAQQMQEKVATQLCFAGTECGERSG